RLAIRGRDLDRAVVVDVDLGAGLLDDLADDLATRTDDLADLVGGDGDRLDTRGEFADAVAGVINGLRHLTEDVLATILGLLKGDLHDLLGNAGDLDVHLQRSDTFGGAGHLEVHVAEMILITQDIGKHRIAVTFEDEA